MQELRFQHLTTTDGLSDNAITCLLEDRKGYIWIGTEHGLNRYDGQRVVRFTGNTAPMGVRITSIAQDSSGTIWVSTTDGGLSRYDAAHDRFNSFMHAGDGHGGLPSDRLNHLLALNDSILVISTQDACLLWCNTKARTFRQGNYNLSDTVTTDTVGRWCHSTLRLDRDRIWLGLIPGGNSFILDAHNGNVLRNIQATHSDSLHSLSNAALVGGAILAGGWGPGITRVSLQHPDRPDFAPLRDEVTAIIPWQHGTIVAGTKINGLLLLDEDLRPLARFQHRRNDQTSLRNNRIRYLLKDSHGDLWVGTADGLSVYAPAVWPMAVHELFPNDRHDQPDLVFHNLQQDRDGAIRISTSHGFITLRDPQATPRHIAVSFAGQELEMTGAFHLGPHEDLVGTETGLFPYDTRNERLDLSVPHREYSPYPTISMYQVRSVFADTLDGQRVLFVCALGFGTNVFDPAPLHFKDHAFTLVMDPSLYLTNCTVLDSTTGSYWSGTTKGIYNWSTRHGQPVDTPVTYMKGPADGRHLPGEDVSAIVSLGDTVWAALRDGALVAICNGMVSSFMVPDHLPGDLRGLAFDDSGRAWCPTSNGLLRFDPRNGSWLHVPVNNGGRFRQLSRCILRLFDGTMAFCVDNCLITFSPASFDSLPPLPRAEVDEVRNAWGPVVPDDQGRLQIPYRASSFEADLVALQPTGPAPLEFLYRLDDLEPEPHVTTASRPVRYAGVPAGTHRLLVRVRDAYGREGPEVAVLTLDIAAPIWQRWWAYALLAALAAGAMYAWSRYRLRQSLKLQAVRDGIARDLHDDVGSTLGSISYYSEALKRRIGAEDNAAHEVADKIGQSSREMIDRMGDIVWSIDPRNDNAGSLEERMRAYATDLLSAHDITLRFPAALDLDRGPLDTRIRRILFLLFKEALNNALKYSGCTTVEVDLRQEGRQLHLRLTDNGSGFDLENVQPYNGNGLRGMATRAESIGGTTKVSSTPGSGTVIEVQVPLGKGIPRKGD